MSQLIGRKEEQDELEDAFNSKKAEFVVIYGRRRVGKTFLVEQFFKKKKSVLFRAIGIQDGTLKEQLGEFSKSLGETFYKGASIVPATSWMQAFEQLTRALAGLPKKSKVILFFDELPWMSTKRSRVLQALDYYWNRHWSANPNIKLIVCGSSASWIIKNIIHNKGGLHNRYTKSLLIKPFSLLETSLFLKDRGVNYNEKQILQLYMTIGGIPHYLEQVKKGLSVPQNIDYLCFKGDGILFSEFDKLFKSLFDDAKIYIEIIRIIAKSREGTSRSDIERKSKFSSKGGTLTDRLRDLELAGFIQAFLPLGHQRQGEYYRIIDEYSYFYLKWIEPERQTLLAQERRNQYWSSKIKTPGYQSWMGYAFEAICYKHVSQIRHALKIGASARAGSWRYRPRNNVEENGAQIDLLFDRDDDAITICEIKHTENPFIIDKEYQNSLLNKITVYKKITGTTKQIVIAFIASSGLKKNSYATKMINNVVTLEDIFKE